MLQFQIRLLSRLYLVKWIRKIWARFPVLFQKATRTLKRACLKSHRLQTLKKSSRRPMSDLRPRLWARTTFSSRFAHQETQETQQGEPRWDGSTRPRWPWSFTSSATALASHNSRSHHSRYPKEKEALSTATSNCQSSPSWILHRCSTLNSKVHRKSLFCRKFQASKIMAWLWSRDPSLRGAATQEFRQKMWTQWMLKGSQVWKLEIEYCL